MTLRLKTSDHIARAGKKVGRGGRVKKTPPQRSGGELIMAKDLREAGIKFDEEVRFHQPEPGKKARQWRFDFVLTDMEKVAIEVEGLKWDGRAHHQSPKGYANDCEKYNTATAQGWRVFRFTQWQIGRREAIKFIIDFTKKRI